MLDHKVNEEENLVQICLRILSLKEVITNRFEFLLPIFPLNTELFVLSHYFLNYILYEPSDKNVYLKKLSVLKQQITIEINKQDVLYSLEEAAFVLGCDLSIETMGNILWSSKNSTVMLELSEKTSSNLNINSIIPKTIRDKHNMILNHYFRYPKDEFVNKMNHLWMLTASNQLFTISAVLKLYFDSNNLQIVTWIRRENGKISLILDEMGNIDSYGTYFNLISHLPMEFPFTNTNISIFLFMPHFIIHFLNYFYGLNNFKLKDFNYAWLDDTYFFIFKDMQAKLIELSKMLSANKEKKESYAQVLAEYLTKLNYSEIVEIYRVNLQTSFKTVSRPDFEFTYCVVTIQLYEQVEDEFTEEKFLQYKLFIDKLRIDESLKLSIQKYDERLTEETTKKQSLSDIDKAKGAMVIHGSRNSNENSNLDETMNNPEALKFKAIEIIKKLFTKNFNPLLENEVPSEIRKTWISVVNSFIQKKNSVISTIIESHVGKLTRNSPEQVQL